MNDSHSLSADDQRIVDDWAERWHALRDQGRDVDLTDLCRERPDLQPALQKRIDALQHENAPADSNVDQVDADDDADVFAESFKESLICDSHYVNLLHHSRGGLGTVYTAHDLRLHRDVAVKFIHRRFVRDDEKRSRFLAEQEITGRLDHPGIVPVHGAGETPQGRPFYVMRFIDGKTLEDAIVAYHKRLAKKKSAPGRNAELALQFRDLLTRFVSVCKTIAYAHKRGIAHCDVKPDNVMIGRYGETTVVDWGLATSFSRDKSAKESGEKTLMLHSVDTSVLKAKGIEGTPRYMSPERAQGKTNLGPHTDVYALGVMLYRILTGEYPFNAADDHEVLNRIVDGNFTPPQQHKPSLPGPLCEVCLKAMSRNPDERHDSAISLAEDVEKFLADEAIPGQHESVSRKFARWTRHHRKAVQSSLALLLLLFAASATMAALYFQAAASEKVAFEEARTARQEGLRFSARLAAGVVTRELERRFDILQNETRSGELATLVAAVKPDDPMPAKAVQEWIISKHTNYQDLAKAYSWFITDRSGRQIARAPLYDEFEELHASVGADYSHRDYFHGQGPDFKQPAEGLPKIITEPHVSAAFLATNKNHVVTLSIPIKDMSGASPRIVGELAMVIEVGNLGLMRLDLGENRRVVLISLKEDQVPLAIDTDQPFGLLLDHPEIASMGANRDKVYRMGPKVLTELQAWMDKTQQDNISFPPRESLFISDYVDPVDADKESHWMASFSPVALRRKAIGWAVAVQEPP
ncbi:serine/threonine protein kinase [Lignipirellula cremea]|uniref:Serine/threonine-protein kinase PknB n=1 Tax=Lignipirellula cremea TaxID=2528010 RepID=A0A518DNW0_9BACT|nr:serine/threonine protein kinase [Lignipirellula cremea]QDU93529.1 Serine/threonine-protein kinase PknB [Lignipirellula cremea]